VAVSAEPENANPTRELGTMNAGEGEPGGSEFAGKLMELFFVTLSFIGIAFTFPFSLLFSLKVGCELELIPTLQNYH